MIARVLEGLILASSLFLKENSEEYFYRVMNKRIDIRVPLKNGFRAVFSSPVFAVFGAAIAIPKGLIQFFVLGGAEFGDMFSWLQSKGGVLFPWGVILFLLLAGIALIVSSFGIVALVFLMNRHESGETPSFSALRRVVRHQTKNLVILEILLIAFVVIVGSILSVPADIALSRGLASLSRALSYSALGLLLSISLLLFFLRQYAALYLSLSKISVRSALENASRLFRLHMRETFLLTVALFCIEFLTLSFFSMSFSLVWNFFETNVSPAVLVYGTIVEWIGMLGVLSLLEAWTWTSWTSFFRMIALPKDPEPVLQKSETMLQQESAVSLDKA